MSILRKLNKASFRGAEFYVVSTSTEGGRKTVSHEYPNTDRRFVEDLGKMQRVFTVDGYISGKDSQYFQRRNALLSALEQPGTGVLIHPFYGSITVVPRPYTITEDMTRLNEAKVSMVFEISSPAVYPKEAANNKSKLTAGANDVLAKASADTSSHFSVSSALNNFRAAQDKLTAVGNKFRDAAEKVNAVSDTVNELNSNINAFRDDINFLINTPSNLAASINAMFVGVSQLTTDPVGQLGILKGFYKFGQTDTAYPSNTASYVERITNNTTINNNINVSALALSYGLLVSFEFGNTDEIDSVEGDLEEQYEYATAGDMDPDLRASLDSLRNESRIYFDRLRLQVAKIIDVTTTLMPITVLNYSYYGNTTLTSELIDLNNISDPSFVSGQVKVLTQ